MTPCRAAARIWLGVLSWIHDQNIQLPFCFLSILLPLLWPAIFTSGPCHALREKPHNCWFGSQRVHNYFIVNYKIQKSYWIKKRTVVPRCNRLDALFQCAQRQLPSQQHVLWYRARKSRPHDIDRPVDIFLKYVADSFEPDAKGHVVEKAVDVAHIEMKHPACSTPRPAQKSF